MAFYCGIDLSARESSLCVIDDNQSIVFEQKLSNQIERIEHSLRRFKTDLRIVVESTFNWYWLVDGLQSAGYDVCLAHTLGLQMITGAKVKTDRRDAYALARLLRAGMIPKAYIYPAQSRAVRDLLRRRQRLVRQRAYEYGQIRQLLLRCGVIDVGRNAVKEIDDDDLTSLFDHPMLVLHAGQELERIRLYSEQLEEMESCILAQAQARPEFTRLQKVPGIGVILGLTILYEIGQIDRFPDVRCFSSYCRLVPGVAQSGTVSRRGRASKQGNPHLKNAFSQAAVTAVRCYPQIKRYFERHLKGQKSGKRKLVVYNIVAHKLARAVYHILRDGAVYQMERLFN
jgi:transposase